jgi:hypothetical protein
VTPWSKFVSRNHTREVKTGFSSSFKRNQQLIPIKVFSKHRRGLLHRKRSFESGIVSVDIFEEMHFAVFLDDGGSVENPFRDGLLEVHP